ncbi:MAG TPA: DUF1697 domain-containing protein [Gemmatimonadales bacterium]|nr:DUF1697 domain-containing protein [Gemmatimonadales bacterium]
MPRYAAFLRAVNVGGRTVPMAELRRLFAGLGLEGVETFIASGNVVFTSRAKAATLEPRIERALADALGYAVPTFLRTGAEVAAIAAREPFDAKRRASAHSIHVGLLHAPLPPAGRKALAALESPADAFEVDGREIWWLPRAGVGQSKITNVLLERRLGAPVTFRNVNTMTRMAARYFTEGIA